MCFAAVTAFDTADSDGYSSAPGFNRPVIVAMSDQAAGMGAGTRQLPE